MTTRSRITAGIGALALTGALAAVPAAASAAVPAPHAAAKTAAGTPAKPARQPTKTTKPAAKPLKRAAKRVVRSTTPAIRPKASTPQLIGRAVARDVAANSVVPASRFTVGRVAISRVDPTWAQAWVLPKKGVQVDPAQVVVHHDRAGWKVKDLGTAEVGCGITPARVLSGWHVTCG